MKIKTDQRIRQIDIKVVEVPAGLLEKKAVIFENIYRLTMHTAIKSRPARQYTKYPDNISSLF